MDDLEGLPPRTSLRVLQEAFKSSENPLLANIYYGDKEVSTELIQKLFFNGFVYRIRFKYKPPFIFGPKINEALDKMVRINKVGMEQQWFLHVYSTYPQSQRAEYYPAQHKIVLTRNPIMVDTTTTLVAQPNEEIFTQGPPTARYDLFPRQEMDELQLCVTTAIISLWIPKVMTHPALIEEDIEDMDYSDPGNDSTDDVSIPDTHRDF